MSLFGNILAKIFRHPAATPAASAPAPAPAARAQAPAPHAAQSVAPAAPAEAVDVAKVLGAIAAQKVGGGGNYQSSIVDLLKLLDLDSSLAARKELADELNIHAGADGSAEQNIALHRGVMDTIVKNGGKVPESLRN